MIQETDITDVEARRSPYSKTFTIPGTKHNNDFFEHYYEVNAVGFDPLTKRQTVVQYRGTDIFKGFLRLNAVLRRGDQIEYEVYILSEITDFTSVVSNKTLKELSWIEYDHIQNYDTVSLSWYANSGSTQGLFGGDVIYPMAHYGYDYQSTTALTPSFTFDITSSTGTGINLSGHSIPPTYFKPAMRVKAIIEKIFENSGYQIVSNFFDTPYFRSIYVDLAMNGQLGVEVASARTNQNIFRVYGDATPQAQEFYYPNGAVQQIHMGRISSTDGYDPQFNFSEGTSSFQVPYSGLYSFEFKGKVNQRYSNNTVPTYYGISIYKATTAAGLSDPNQRVPVTGTTDGLVALNYLSSNNIRIFLNDVQLNAGDHIGLFIRFNTSGSSNKNAGLWVGPTDWVGFGARWDLYNSPNITQSNFVDMKLQFPEIESIDFIKAIIKMFNLVVVQTDEVKKIRIEPLPWYFSEEFANSQDWTEIMDQNSVSKLEPVNFQLKKGFKFQYLSAEEEHLGKIYEDQYEVPFGTKRFTATSDILTGENILEFPFRPYPSEVISGSTNIIIPQVYRLDLATGREVAYSNKNHIFFWTGNRYFYQDQGNTNPQTWWMTSGATPIEQTTYPCVSHLSSLDKLDQEDFSDLNFDKTFDFFGDNNTVINQFTANNIYQLWYNDYFTNLYSPETKRLTGRFLFNPINISQISLTDKIFIKDAVFQIEKINEADLVNWKLTEVSLLKVVAQYNKYVPPGPDHSILPNAAYPASGSVYPISGYVSNQQTEICNLTISSTTFYASTASVGVNTFIYQDMFGTTPYPTGTFVYEIGGSNTFVVINNLGQVLVDNC